MFRMVAIACLFAAGTAMAADTPKLKDTELFKSIAKGCKDVNMGGWHHPTGKAFLERGIRLERVSLCNNKRFPIFYVDDVPYDPHLAHNDNYFAPLYSALLKANAQWPFAIVVTNSNVILYVSGKSNAIKDEVEDYAD